jgi:hypothetical protein
MWGASCTTSGSHHALLIPSGPSSTSARTPAPSSSSAQGRALPRRYRLLRAVVLHMARPLPPAKENEVLLLEAGVACDVAGARSREVSARAIDELASSTSSPSCCDPRSPQAALPRDLAPAQAQARIAAAPFSE